MGWLRPLGSSMVPAEGRARALACTGDAALKDMGLSRSDVPQESERAFWLIPCELNRRA
jgi:hypothetical protein